ncbi:MAG: S9 family peptidase [Crocinitomicaceae bacterium]|nr:S9 family peptidase [Crocinitomicaceae bacterium]
MIKYISSTILLLTAFVGVSQTGITPQQLIELNRVAPMGISKDGDKVVYAVSKVDVATNSRSKKFYTIGIDGGRPVEIKEPSEFLTDKDISPNGRYKITVQDVKLKKVFGTDFYPELKESNMMVYDQLNYRHWDQWEDGAYSHLIVEPTTGKEKSVDIMLDEPYDCPQKPFGGPEDYIWCPESNEVYYVTKKKYGTDYAVSTNTDIYVYNLETGETTNFTEGNLGYDTQPAFSSTGRLAWLQMKRDGYESDKNDIIIKIDSIPVNLTAAWDGTVNGFHWSNDGKTIYFTAPTNGTVQLFSVPMPKSADKLVLPTQITSGQFDVRGIVGHKENSMVVMRGDMNHASELYHVDLKTGEMRQLTQANTDFYNNIEMSKVEKRMVKTTDGKDMLCWVIYPPNFDPKKKYPTLLYCQGGPQGALSQFYSFRWNFQLMASHGYIIIAPNRRGMPGYGVEWNEQISKDYGGQNMRDYLSAIDDLSKESYVDKNRLGCIGASYGGYSVFYLASRHNNRFKSFVAHDGIFNWKSMYGTTEELFFVNWDLGGAYWDQDNEDVKNAYGPFNPVEHVHKWNAPILIIQGGKDFRVPIGQGLEAFQAAKLQGLNSKLLYFPDENHWVLDYQNSLIWHSEFYKWLGETLPPIDR